MKIFPKSIRRKFVLHVLFNNGEKTEMVWARHEDGRRSRSEESDDESDTGEKEETKDKVEGCVQEGHADCRTERGRCRRQGLLERDDQQP